MVNAICVLVRLTNKMVVALLTPLQTEFLVNLLANYHRALTKQLAKRLPPISKKDRAILLEKLTITDEIADLLNVIFEEGEGEEITF